MHQERKTNYLHETEVFNKAQKTVKSAYLSGSEWAHRYDTLVQEYGKLLHNLKNRYSQNHYASTSMKENKASDMKFHLISNISHEFRTPLSLILTPLEEMLAKCKNQKQKKTLSLMLRNAQRLTFLTNQMLELSKIEDQSLLLNASLYDLVIFLKGIVESFQVLADKSEVNLVFSSTLKKISLYFEPEKIAEVICNLLMNALKYTPKGGQIQVKAGISKGDIVKIVVNNTGPSIPWDQMSIIFDRYYQLTQPFEHHKKGFGIGLFLVKEYVELHDGTIDVNSSDEVGTEFIIHLPKGINQIKKEQFEATSNFSFKATEIGKAISQHYSFMLGLERESQHENLVSTKSDETSQFSKRSVLVVEDSEDMRHFICDLLKTQFDVVTATNGKEGIEIARRRFPDIIISDIVMPEVDGYKLCQTLKNDINTCHIPIILLSARVLEDDIIRGLKIGADDYVTKPFNISMLLARIKNLVLIRQQLQQKIQQQMQMKPNELLISPLDNDLLKQVNKLIERNLSEQEFGLDEMANALYMSRSTLYRKMLALTGQSPKKFIQNYRLRKSVELLQKSDYSITQLAYKVGFSSAAYFTKCFKEFYNKTPSKFINRE